MSTNLDIEPIKSRKFTVEQVDKALLVLAIHGGNSLRAADELKSQDVEIDDSTLRIWREKYYPNRYLHLQQTFGRQLEDVLVANQREIALSATQAALLAIGKAQEEIAAGRSKDPARAAQALQTTAGIATDKVLTLTGRPTQVTEHRDYKQVLQKYGGAVIEGTAEEVPHEATSKQTTAFRNQGDTQDIPRTVLYPTD